VLAGFDVLTLGVQHPLNSTTDASSLTQDDKLESVAGYECHILAGIRHAVDLVRYAGLWLPLAHILGSSGTRLNKVQTMQTLNVALHVLVNFTSFKATPRHAGKSICRTESQKNTMSLVGKTCLITGASRGIGAAIAKCFAAEGASCILTGRGEGRLEVARRSLSAGRDETQRHRFLVGDVAQRAWWMDVVKQEVRSRDSKLSPTLPCRGPGGWLEWYTDAEKHRRK
jgi:hypothetical protein